MFRAVSEVKFTQEGSMTKRQERTGLLIIGLMVIAVIAVLLFLQPARGQTAPPAPKQETIPISKSGRIALRAVAADIQRLQADINDLAEAERTAHTPALGPEWQIDINAGVMVRVVPPKAEPAKPVPPVPAAVMPPPAAKAEKK
jgi:hypothetical protein